MSLPRICRMRSWVCVVALLVCPWPAARSCGAQFSSGVNLVEVYVTVTDAAGGVVTGLPQSVFEVYEDGQRQTIGTFVAGEFPLSVALAVDRSWSMAGERLTLAKAAAQNFLGQLRPSDQSALLAVGGDLETIAPLSADRAAQHRALDELKPWGTTGLHDAIISSLALIQPAQGRRALVLLSDGDDRYSNATAADALEQARRSDVLVYPVALGKSRPPLFAQIAVTTGGRSFHLREPKLLAPTFKTIADELRNQYLIGYTPTRPIVAGTSEWRSIEVRVARTDVRVRARDGYMPH